MTKDSSDSREIMCIIGEVALRSHLIEDLLRLHLFEAGRFGFRGKSERSVKEVQSLRLEDVIAEFRIMYPEHSSLADAFDLHRKLRNKMFHAFCPDLGGDLKSIEGRDQIHALLFEIAELQRRHLAPLKMLHEDLLRTILKNSFVAMLEKTNDWNVKTVAKSDLFKLVEKLRRMQA